MSEDIEIEITQSSPTLLLNPDYQPRESEQFDLNHRYPLQKYQEEV